jgi:hypothetical protein
MTQMGLGPEDDLASDSHAPSAEWSGSGRAPACPPSTRMPGRRGIWARMAADGSTARTARSNQSLNAAANAPVPAPMFHQRHARRRPEMPPDCLAPRPEPVSRDLADGLIRRRGLVVVADPGHPVPPYCPCRRVVLRTGRLSWPHKPQHELAVSPASWENPLVRVAGLPAPVCYENQVILAAPGAGQADLKTWTDQLKGGQIDEEGRTQ